ncbi:hypothetical protein ACFQ4O_15135, partial [Methylopila musalis]
APPAARARPYEPTAAEIRALKPTAAERARHTPSQAQIAAMGERFRPEYNRRLSQQGKAAADAWIRQKGHEIGLRQAQEAKRRILIERHRAGQAAQR